MKCPLRIWRSSPGWCGVLIPALLHLLFFPAAYGQLNTASSQTFTTRDGLSSNHISAIVQDQRGFIWLATDEGLDRYDGTQFTAFYHKDSDPNTLPANTIRDMVLLPGNRLVLATFDGLCLFNTISAQCRTFQEADNPDYYSFNNNFIFVRYDHYHHIWAASKTTLYQFDDSLRLLKKWRNPQIKANPYAYAELPFTYPDGKPGFLLNRVCYQYDPRRGDLKKDRFLTQAIHDHLTVDFIAGNRYGIWWIYHNNDSLFHLGPQKEIQRYQIPLPDAKRWRLSFLSTRHDSILWCGNNGGELIRFNMKQHRFLHHYMHFTNAPALGTWVFTTSVLWDNQQNLWISTVNSLHKYSTHHRHIAIWDTTFYFKKAPVKTADVNALLKTDQGYWVGTYGNGLFWIDPVKHLSRHFHFHFNYKEVGRNWIWHIGRYFGDTLWIGTQDGLIWFNTKNYRYDLVRGHGLPAFIDTFTVMTQFVDSHHMLWMGIGGGHGLIQYNLQTKQARLYKKSALPIPAVTCMSEDENGDLWMASMAGGGLVRWHRATDQFSVTRAHPHSAFEDDKIYTIYADKQGSVWFSAGAAGLGQYDLSTGRIRIYGRQQGICSQLINSITGKKDHLWIGTFNGLSRFNIHTKQFKNYSAIDGFPDNYFVYVYCRDGWVYACGAMNMSIFQDSALNQNPYPPQVYLTGMQIRDKPMAVTPFDNLRLASDQNYIRFDYTGINYINGKENHYAYKLDGVNPDWVPAGSSRYAIYASLSPGTYTFRVKAVNSAGLWSKNQAAYTFTIIPPFWENLWFLMAIVLVASSGIYLFYRYRLHQVLRMQRVRDQIASDLHDDMGASLSNINILSTMALLNHEEDKPTLRKMLENIREDAQQTSEAIDDIVWAVNPKNDSLDRILSRMRYYASELFEAKGIQYVINFPADVNRIRLPMIQRRGFFLIFKEAVNNMVKHAACTRALIEITLQGDHIHMELTDNGKGFDTEEDFEGNGLKNMQQRAQDIHAKLCISSQPGKGSTLTLSL